jgi:hypothetical protein
VNVTIQCPTSARTSSSGKLAKIADRLATHDGQNVRVWLCLAVAMY